MSPFSSFSSSFDVGQKKNSLSLPFTLLRYLDRSGQLNYIYIYTRFIYTLTYSLLPFSLLFKWTRNFK